MNRRPHTLRLSLRVLATPAAALLAAGTLAACGGSSAPKIVLAPSAGATAAPATTPTPTTPTTPTTTTATPTTGPLSKEPTVTPPSGPPPAGLVVKDLVKGVGVAATKGRSITVNYVGVLYKGGKQFDASWKRSTTFTTTLGNGSVIPGWDQGLVGMKVGGRRELIIPPKLGYGAQGSPPTIPPNATLVFVIDLLKVS